jgi:hypothetical protein
MVSVRVDLREGGAMRKTYTRVIVVEYSLSDPKESDSNEYDNLADYTDDQIICEEKKTPLSNWFSTTNLTVTIDEIVVRNV